jgi:hypothetical protein
VSTTLYAGGGHLIEPNNETNPTEYDSHREGVGAIGHWRMERGDLGPFVMMAGTFELESLTQTACPWGCDPRYELGSYHTEKHFAGRFALGYSFRYVEFRGGVLLTRPDEQAILALPMAMPEVLLRLGHREVGWFELGLGAFVP